MNNRIDQLFKDTLGEYHISPSEEAWGKIQSGLPKKNKMAITWRLAAVFVLFAILMGSWFLGDNSTSNDPTKVVTTNNMAVPDKSQAAKSTEPVVESESPKPNHRANAASSKKIIESHDANEGIEYTKQKNIASRDTEIVTDIDDREIAAATIQIVQKVKEEKPIVIEFRLEPVSKNAVASGNLDIVENSGLKKLLEVAREVKNGDSDLGVIRETKNQLFALDFRKDRLKRN